MSTAPFSVSQINKLQAGNQAVRWFAQLKEVRQFRAYCCNIDSDGIMGVAKEPVIIADISPNPVCLTAAISWDISDSYAPGSTLVTWDIDFGDGIGTASGVDFPNDVTNGAYTYLTAGTFTITITIAEAARSQTSEVEVTVLECGDVAGSLLWTYVATNGFGVYFIDWTDDNPGWETKNEGLEGNALRVRSLVQKPKTKNLQPANHELWVATMIGVYRTYNGGNSWEEVSMPDPSNAEFLDSPAATVDELDWQHIVFDPTNENIVYILASKEA